MTTIYLLRHGEITQNKPRRFVGQQELPLTIRGQEQILQAARYLVDKNIQQLWCSPLSRCVKSAQIIGQTLSLEPRIVSNLREISLGAWEGLTQDQVQECFPGQFEARGQDLANYRPEDGESFVDVQKRAWLAWEQIIQEKQTSAIVAHSGVNRVLLCKILGLPLENLFRFDLDYGSITTLVAKQNSFVVQSLNYLAYPVHE